MSGLSPLIKPTYIQPYEVLSKVIGNPFTFPMDLDDSSVNASGEMILVCDYLNRYKGNKSTLANYTKEMEKLLQWLWRVKEKYLLKISRQDALEYVEFIQAPPFHWVARGGSVAKFINQAEDVNPKWRPFSARSGKEFKASAQSVRATLSAVNGLYYHLIERGHTQINPFLKVKNPLLQQIITD